MKWYWAILFTITLLLLTIGLSGIIEFDLSLVMIPLSALFVAIDSKKISLVNYKSGISYRPIPLFFAVTFLWIAGLPWYLHVRYKIVNGIAELKDHNVELDSDAR